METIVKKPEFHTVYGDQESLKYYDRIDIPIVMKKKLRKIFTKLNLLFKCLNEIYTPSLVDNDRLKVKCYHHLIHAAKRESIQKIKEHNFPTGIESGLLDFINIKTRNLDFIITLNKKYNNNTNNSDIDIEE